MKKKLSLLFILASMLFPACENELPYMDKPQAPQLLMNAFLEAGKEENGVFLRMVEDDELQADYVSNGSIPSMSMAKRPKRRRWRRSMPFPVIPIVS